MDSGHADTPGPDSAAPSDRMVVMTRSFDHPVDAVFAAWADSDRFRRWWLPGSSGMTMVSCRMDVRTGGSYRIEIAHPALEQPMAFFGSYTDVAPNARIVWTNEESLGGAVTSVTFTAQGDATLLVYRDVYPTAAARDEAAQGMPDGMAEQFAQLDALLAAE